MSRFAFVYRCRCVSADTLGVYSIPGHDEEKMKQSTFKRCKDYFFHNLLEKKLLIFLQSR